MELPNSVALVLRRIAQIEGAPRTAASISNADPFESFVATARQRPKNSAHLDGLISRVAQRWRLDGALVKAVVANESSFDSSATSVTGAMGLMQLEPATASELGISDPYDAAQNLNGGARYLRGLLDRFGQNLPLALAAYNAGPHAVEKYGGIPPYAETRAYVQNVLASYREYKKGR